MNGEYRLATQGSGAPKPNAFPTNFMSYPGGVESFDAYHGPINSTYSQVWWTSAEDALPQDIVDRFAGKVMAIVGVEMDQVRKTPHGDVSVPINIAYNHHHNTMIVGQGAHLEITEASDPRVKQAVGGKFMKFSDGKVWLPVEHQPSSSGMPTSAMFDDGNGGEYRKSFHAYAPPFAQLVESPNKIAGIAMQIDTWNRDKMDLTGSPFVPGPVPFHNLAPLSGPDAIYSGLLECPLTTRIQKLFDGSPDFNDTASLQAFDSCPSGNPTPTPSPTNSFCVAQNVNGISGDVSTPGINTSTLVYAGKVPTSTACESICQSLSAKCTGFTWISPSFSQAAWRQMCYIRTGGVMQTSPQQGIVTGVRRGAPGQDGLCPAAPRCAHNMTSAIQCFDFAASIVNKFVGDINVSVVNNKTVSKADGTPPGCSLAQSDIGHITVTFNSNQSSVGCCSANSESDMHGVLSILDGHVLVKVNISGSTNTVDMQITGPSNVWFAVGFNAISMADQPYTIVVEGGHRDIYEYKLGNHAPGTLLSSSVSVVSDTIDGKRRTVVLSRPLQGKTKEHYTFDPTVLGLNIISAVGVAPQFGPHSDAPHGTSMIQFFPAQMNKPLCICSNPADPFGQGKGRIKYLPTGETIGFSPGRCPPQPRGDLLEQRNPTCDLRTYVGGLATCRHGWHLLDAEQEIPWMDQPLSYYKKFRVYFQEYNASRHRQIVRMDWGIGAGGNHDEYDVPRCSPGTPVSDCKHNITGTWAPIPESGPDVYLVALHHHCHAPTCLRVDTYNNDTGELLCRTDPVYGGTNGFVSDRPEFDEPGYIATPSCMWGYGPGLNPPPRMNGMTIHVVATTNSTYGHHGEMALPQAMVSYGASTEH